MSPAVFVAISHPFCRRARHARRSSGGQRGAGGRMSAGEEGMRVGWTGRLVSLSCFRNFHWFTHSLNHFSVWNISFSLLLIRNWKDCSVFRPSVQKVQDDSMPGGGDAEVTYVSVFFNTLWLGGARYFLELRMKIGISYATVDGDETGLLRKFQSDWSTETRVMNPQRCAGMSPRNPP